MTENNGISITVEFYIYGHWHSLWLFVYFPGFKHPTAKSFKSIILWELNSHQSNSVIRMKNVKEQISLQYLLKFISMAEFLHHKPIEEYDVYITPY